MPQQVATPPPRTRPSRARRALRVVERSLAVSGLLFLVWHSAFGTAEVISGSMAPTLTGAACGAAENDWVLYETVSPRLGAPERDDLVLFKNDEGVQIVKRVVGTGGQRLRIVDGRLEVDGALLAPPAEGVRYLRAGHLRQNADGPQAYVVPAGHAFVLGDDSKDSWDSRYFGALEASRLQGRAVAVIWPPARWRWL